MTQVHLKYKGKIYLINCDKFLRYGCVIQYTKYELYDFLECSKLYTNEIEFNLLNKYIFHLYTKYDRISNISYKNLILKALSNDKIKFCKILLEHTCKRHDKLECANMLLRMNMIKH